MSTYGDGNTLNCSPVIVPEAAPRLNTGEPSPKLIVALTIGALPPPAPAPPPGVMFTVNVVLWPALGDVDGAVITTVGATVGAGVATAAFFMLGETRGTSAGGADEAGERREEARLPGAVRADDGVDGPRLDREAHVGQGGDAAKVQDDAVRIEKSQIGPRCAANGRRRVASWASGP